MSNNDKKSSLIFETYTKIRAFYDNSREVTEDEQKKLKRWKAWIKKEDYDVKSRIEEIRALLADTSCKECLNENYVHSTQAHREFAKLQKEVEEK